MIVHRKKLREEISRLLSYSPRHGECGTGTRLITKQALAWLYSLQRFGIKLGLEISSGCWSECCSGACVKRQALAAASASTTRSSTSPAQTARAPSVP